MKNFTNSTVEFSVNLEKIQRDLQIVYFVQNSVGNSVVYVVKFFLLGKNI